MTLQNTLFGAQQKCPKCGCYNPSGYNLPKDCLWCSKKIGDAWKEVLKITPLIEEMEIKRLPKGSECKGRFYRGRVSGYLNSRNEYVYTEKMIPLKRMSCPGCEKCGWVDDELSMFISEKTYPEVIGGIEDGELYTIDICNISHDWESGIVDDYDLVFTKVVDIGRIK